jgi:hypothetical protein
LRSGYNYQTIAFVEIENATIKKASAIKNILLCTILAALLLGFSFYEIMRLYFFFTEPYSFSIDVHYVVLPVLPGAIGGYLLYLILRKEPILEIIYQSKLVKLKITKTIKQGKLQALESYLRNYLKHLEVKLSIAHNS